MALAGLYGRDARGAATDIPLFDGVPAADSCAARLRRRVGVEEVRELRRRPAPVRPTPLTAFCHVRGRQITDTLTVPLTITVHRVGAETRNASRAIRRPTSNAWRQARADVQAHGRQPRRP